MAEEDQEEQVLMVPLRDARKAPRTKRAPRAIEAVRDFISRHMKADRDDVWIDPEVNQLLWRRGIQKPPPRARLRAIKFEDGRVEVSLPEE